jgi:hypothetical protein
MTTLRLYKKEHNSSHKLYITDVENFEVAIQYIKNWVMDKPWETILWNVWSEDLDKSFASVTFHGELVTRFYVHRGI